MKRLLGFLGVTALTLLNTFAKNYFQRKMVEEYKRDILSKVRVPDVGLNLEDILKIGRRREPDEIERAIVNVGSSLRRQSESEAAPRVSFSEAAKAASETSYEPREGGLLDDEFLRRLKEMPELVMDANEYTKHELLKEFYALEKHLKQAAYMEKNFCLECAVKHLAGIEELAEEGLAFAQNDRERELYRRIAEWAYKAQAVLIENRKDPMTLAEEARKLRKDLEKLMSGISQFLEGLESRLMQKTQGGGA